MARGEGARDQSERDHRRARTEAALARDPARELEVLARDRNEPGERLDAEVRLIELADALFHL